MGAQPSQRKRWQAWQRREPPLPRADMAAELARGHAHVCVGLAGLGLAGLGVAWSGGGGPGGALHLPSVPSSMNWHFGESIGEALSASSAMILGCELGDETFIMAAVMAMRHPKLPVLAGSLSALYLMTALSALLGVMLPNLISQEVVHNCATVLYCFFGLRLIWMGHRADEEDKEEEFQEAERCLNASAKDANFFQTTLGRLLTPVFMEAFLLTFLAEWGDRSQIATVSLASHLQPVGVVAGAAAGHTVCSSLAVFGGEWLGKRISQRAVAFGGGLLFLVFALLSALGYL